MPKKEKKEKPQKASKKAETVKKKPRKRGFRELKAIFDSCFQRGEKETEKDFSSRKQKAWEVSRLYGNRWNQKRLN